MIVGLFFCCMMSCFGLVFGHPFFSYSHFPKFAIDNLREDSISESEKLRVLLSYIPVPDDSCTFSSFFCFCLFTKKNNNNHISSF